MIICEMLLIDWSHIKHHKPIQGANVQDGQILEDILIAYECIDKVR